MAETLPAEVGPPRRIVSFVPSATEWACAFGLGGRLVGVSHECDHPPEIARLPRLTRSRIASAQSAGEIDQAVRRRSADRESLYDVDGVQLRELQPDLVLTQTLCSVCAVSEPEIRATLSHGEPLQCFDFCATTFSQVLEEAARFADRYAVAGGAAAMQTLEARIRAVRDRPVAGPRPKVMLLEWVAPLFSAGHWNPELIEWAGGIDPIAKPGERSREICFEELWDAAPDLLLIACCGMSREASSAELDALTAQPGWKQLPCCRTGDVYLCDGSSWFNRPGPRLVDALEYVASRIDAWRASRSTQ